LVVFTVYSGNDINEILLKVVLNTITLNLCLALLDMVYFIAFYI